MKQMPHFMSPPTFTAEPGRSAHLPGIFLFLILFPILSSCSSGKPPEEVITGNIAKMVQVDRAINFNEEVTAIDILSRTVFQDRVEVEVRVEGWATHPDLVIGAVLPVSKDRKPGWAKWKFFCREEGKGWVVVDKYKIEEGFEEQ